MEKTVYKNKSGDYIIRKGEGCHSIEVERDENFFTKGSIFYRKYRGEAFPAIGATYNDRRQIGDLKKKSLVSTERFNKILKHDMKCTVDDFGERAQKLMKRSGSLCRQKYCTTLMKCCSTTATHIFTDFIFSEVFTNKDIVNLEGIVKPRPYNHIHCLMIEFGKNTAYSHFIVPLGMF